MTDYNFKCIKNIIYKDGYQSSIEPFYPTFTDEYLQCGDFIGFLHRVIRTLEDFHPDKLELEFEFGYYCVDTKIYTHVHATYNYYSKHFVVKPLIDVNHA